MTELLKVSGAGNDFLVQLEPERDPTPDEVRAWCTRGFAFGADGLFVLRRERRGRVRMEHWNADGGRAELCLNGTRCAARLAFELGWAGDEVTLATGAGPVTGRRGERPAEAAIEVPGPAAPPRALAPELAGRSHPGWLLRFGVPHFVLLAEGSLAGAPVAELGAELRRHPDVGPTGANVNWIRFPDRQTLEIRTFERGVEAETLACGTGILSALAVGLHLDLCDPAITARVLGGFALRATARPTGAGPATFTLAGDARYLGRLTLAPDAATPPPAPPRWS